MGWVRQPAPGDFRRFSCVRGKWDTIERRGTVPRLRDSPSVGIPLGPHLPIPADLIFERGQLLGTDRTARVELARRNADLAAEAELAAVGELRRRVPQHDCAVDAAQEMIRGGGVLGDDSLGVASAELT